MAETFGRVAIDDRGVRKAPWLWLFGERFDLAWSDITGWAAFEAVLSGGGAETVVARSIELHTTGKIHFAEVSASHYTAIVAALEQRLPGKRVESVVERVQRLRSGGGS